MWRQPALPTSLGSGNSSLLVRPAGRAESRAIAWGPLTGRDGNRRTGGGTAAAQYPRGARWQPHRGHDLAAGAYLQQVKQKLAMEAGPVEPQATQPVELVSADVPEQLQAAQPAPQAQEPAAAAVQQPAAPPPSRRVAMESPVIMLTGAGEQGA